MLLSRMILKYIIFSIVSTQFNLEFGIILVKSNPFKRNLGRHFWRPVHVSVDFPVQRFYYSEHLHLTKQF